MGDFSPVKAAVDAIAKGEVVIVVDAEDQDTGGDFICGAEKATPEAVNLVMSGRGEFYLAVLPDVAGRLQLAPMVNGNPTTRKMAQWTSIDHSSAPTGVTASERSTTVLSAVNAESHAGDFVRPGHVQPLLAKQGGVLRRAGHTEAAVDLARLAGLTPAGVLCEIIDELGKRASRQQLLQLAERHQLKIISIEALIAHRRLSEKLVQREAETVIPTRYGNFTLIVYSVTHENQEPLALVFGDLTDSSRAPLVRMHSSCFTGDLVNSLRCDCGDQLHMALEQISAEGAGALVYLLQEGRGIGLKHKIQAYALQDQGLDTVEANVALGFKADPRDYGIGIQILKDLGLSEVRLLTNNTKKLDALFSARGFGLTVVDQVPIISLPNEHNRRYLDTKREKMGHRLPGWDRSPSSIERLNHNAPNGPFAAAIFDFDGTISLFRRNWQEIMIPMMVGLLAECQSGESNDELHAVVEEFVMRLNGRQTIYQMIQLCDEIRKRGGAPHDPLVYKNQYHELLWAEVGSRVDSVEAGETDPETLRVPGAIQFLTALRARDVRLYLASGTDLKYVRREAEALGLTEYFEDRIYGALDDYKKFSKAKIIERLVGEIGDGERMVGFGDGFVEIEEVKKVGGLAVGVASNENERCGVNAWKRERLAQAGADWVVPDFCCFQEIIDSWAW
ncbi:MAG TPA: GTP cyclohydrolase II [Planctomycetes bacterium]|nr:GTP cyclohydrolase II [Planctomycetaceae bacterium]HIM30861.1 GTP cyclohydrolase II [Planctomycetota bacterium]